MKLVKILSDKVQIRSDYKEFDDVRINDLIAVSDGDVEPVTMVNTLTDIAVSYTHLTLPTKPEV